MHTLSTLTAFGLVALSTLTAASPVTGQKAHVKVDTNTIFQEIDGFGTSEAFQRAENIFNQTKEVTDEVLDLMFSLEKGAGFTILRNGIGSSNSSESNFMNSIEPFSPGSPSSKANYVWDHYNSGQFPLAKEAYARGLQKLYADAWSAPGYMKTNNDDANGGYLCGVKDAHCASGNWMQAYADYLVQYARFYANGGVKVTNIGFLNEPQFDATYASMLSNGTQAAEFIRVLAPTIKASGLDIEINCCDGIGWEQQEVMMPGLKAGSNPAEQYLGVVTGHGYSSPPNFPLSTDKKTWLTEWADLDGDNTPFNYSGTGPGTGYTWASNIQVALTAASNSAFLYWEGAESAVGNSCLINMVNGTVITSKRYWVMAQFSKYVRPKAHRVEATSSQPDLTVSSFLNVDGSIATQLLNNNTAEYEVTLKVDGKHSGPMQLYLTNDANNLTTLAPVFAGSDGTFKATVPGESMLSFVSSQT